MLKACSSIYPTWSTMIAKHWKHGNFSSAWRSNYNVLIMYEGVIELLYHSLEAWKCYTARHVIPAVLRSFWECQKLLYAGRKLECQREAIGTCTSFRFSILKNWLQTEFLRSIIKILFPVNYHFFFITGLRPHYHIIFLAFSHHLTSYKLDSSDVCGLAVTRENLCRKTKPLYSAATQFCRAHPRIVFDFGPFKICKEVLLFISEL